MKKLTFSYKFQTDSTFLHAIGSFLLATSNLFAQEVTIFTDQDDYWPGETVIIQGNCRIPGDTVQLSITHIGDYIPEHTHTPWILVAETDGTLYDTWYVEYTELGTTMWPQAQLLEFPEIYAESVFTDAAGSYPSPMRTGRTNPCLATGTTTY